MRTGLLAHGKRRELTAADARMERPPFVPGRSYTTPASSGSTGTVRARQGSGANQVVGAAGAVGVVASGVGAAVSAGFGAVFSTGGGGSWPACRMNCTLTAV